MAFRAAHSIANLCFYDVCQFNVHINTLRKVTWNCTFFHQLCNMAASICNTRSFPLTLMLTHFMNQNKHHIATHAQACKCPVRLTFHRPLFPSLSIYLSPSLCEDGECHHAKVILLTQTILSEMYERGEHYRWCDVAWCASDQIWSCNRKKKADKIFLVRAFCFPLLNDCVRK